MSSYLYTLIVHYATRDDRGRACGTHGGMRSTALSEVNCPGCQATPAYKRALRREVKAS